MTCGPGEEEARSSERRQLEETSGDLGTGMSVRAPFPQSEKEDKQEIKLRVGGSG